MIHRVLVVEDDRLNGKLLQLLLKKYRPNLQVILAESGKTALELAQSSKPSLLLLDMQLPDMNGIELIYRVREAGIEAPAIAVTANDDPSVIARAAAAGFSSYVRKPYDLPELLVIVDAALRSEE